VRVGRLAALQGRYQRDDLLPRLQQRHGDINANGTDLHVHRWDDRSGTDTLPYRG
jgi:hypothetical protein